MRLKLPGPPRRWFQISLRGLLATLTVFGVWLGNCVNKARQQRELVAAVREVDGLVAYQNFDEGTIRMTKPERAGWLRRKLGDDYFENVRRINFNSSTVNDDWLCKHAGRLRSLKSLEFLALSTVYRGVSERGVNSLKDLAALRKLYLPGRSVSDATMANLDGMRRLEGLNLRDARITDAGLASLQNLTRLKQLTLHGTRVGDDGIACLRHLTNLTGLDLGRTDVTDTGLVHLKGLVNLERLDLYGTRVTAQGVKELGGSLPKCRIDYGKWGYACYSNLD